MTCENPYKATFRFQRVEGEGCDIWSARNDGMLIDLFVKDERIVQIDINGFELEFVPFCEGAGDGECKCFFEGDDFWAEVDCPWGEQSEESTSTATYDVDLPFNVMISKDEIDKCIKEDPAPDFGAPASLTDALSFTWMIMDEVGGARVILEGGQVSRPKTCDEDEE